MCVDRREFLHVSAGAAGATLIGCSSSTTSGTKAESDVPEFLQGLRPMTDGIKPITDEERLTRIEKAQKLMAENGLEAVYLESGSSLFYYTGIRWGRSERMLAMVMPAKGDIAYVCPGFEEERARELIRFGDDIRPWEEDESPYKRVAQIFKDRGISTGKVGMEERVRFFLFDGIRKEAPNVEYVSADPVTIGCRVTKSPAELALMQRAMDITIEAYKATVKTLHEGMTKGEFRENSRMAHKALGVDGGIGVNFGEATALPHGSIKPRNLREGDVVLMDGGCGVDGYRSDISRTIVFGTPTQKMQDMWDLEKKAQWAAFEAAKVGVPCEDVDAAARKVLTDAGLGSDYQVPGCPHRTEHGIGLDGHEWTNFVRGNKTPLSPGMCFSNEPMIVIPGEFGIRLEDCVYITEVGAKFFTEPSPAIDQPFA